MRHAEAGLEMLVQAGGIEQAEVHWESSVQAGVGCGLLGVGWSRLGQVGAGPGRLRTKFKP